jgi:hypothetical protein
MDTSLLAGAAVSGALGGSRELTAGSPWRPAPVPGPAAGGVAALLATDSGDAGSPVACAPDAPTDESAVSVSCWLLGVSIVVAEDADPDGLDPTCDTVVRAGSLVVIADAAAVTV